MRKQGYIHALFLVWLCMVIANVVEETYGTYIAHPQEIESWLYLLLLDCYPQAL